MKFSTINLISVSFNAEHLPRFTNVLPHRTFANTSSKLSKFFYQLMQNLLVLLNFH